MCARCGGPTHIIAFFTDAKMAMAMLLASFDIEAVDTADGQPAQERMAFTMNPVGLTMRLKERA